MYKIPIKTENEINIMREGGKILASILGELKSISKIGLDIWVLEENFLRMCSEYNVIPACKGYAPSGFPPFPTGLCVSLNDQSVHCFPVKNTFLKIGDLLTIDTVIKYKSMYLDSAISFGIGLLSEQKQKLLEITQKALDEAISCVKPGNNIGLISNTIQNIAEKSGFSVLTDYAGHGIGKKMHEPPEVPCFGIKDMGPILTPGMVIAIEPLICEKSNILKHNNYWETKTADGGNFAQIEHTVLVTQKGYEILTKI